MKVVEYRLVISILMVLCAVAGFRYRPIEEKTRIVNEVERNVWPLIERQEVKPVVQHRFPFSRASDAHRLMESGMHLGKILLIPDDRFDNNWLLVNTSPKLYLMVDLFLHWCVLIWK